jgi:hypothetical protein
MFGNFLIGSIIGNIVRKTTTQTVIKQVAVSQVTKSIMNSGTNKNNKKKAVYGDVIGVKKIGYKHFGIFISNDRIIHYAPISGDFGKDIYIHETTLNDFLSGSDSYFVCEFPKIHGKPTEINIKKSLASSYTPNGYDTIEVILLLTKLIKKFKYKVYSPEETVERASERLGETKYNLAINNCEHFAIWCKTGISESHQVNDVLDLAHISTINV